MPIFAHPRFGPLKKPVFLPPFQVLGHVAHMFFRFLLHRFCVFLHDFCIFSHFFVKFSACANAYWQILGVICCVSDDHLMQISHNFPTCTVEITQHALLYGWNYPVRSPVWLKLSCTLSCMVEITQHTLLYGWNYPAHPSVWLKLSNTPFCTVEIIQHALKGQKLLAQGNALGINDIQLTPCKGKSFTYRRGFSFFY